MDDPSRRSLSSAWSLPLLCVGLGLIAICVLIPAAEANKRLTADRDKLTRDLTYVQSQLSANQEFLSVAGTDPEIAERLAQRQMRQIRQGTRVLELKGISRNTVMSPFAMISVPRPAEVNEYRPLTGLLGDVCGSTHRQLYAVGLGMLLVATSLVIGASGERAGDLTAERTKE